MSKKRFNLMYGEKYEDRNGDEKTAWKRVGTLFVDSESGGISIKLDSIPIGRKWNGWLQAFEPKDWDNRGDEGGDGGNAGEDKAPMPDDKPIDLSEIPF